MIQPIIFIPDALLNERSGYLWGVCNESELSHVFYVLGTRVTTNPELTNLDILGTYINENERFNSISNKSNWVSVRQTCGEVELLSVVVNSEPVNLDSCRIILYEKETFLHTELFLPGSTSNIHNEDYFRNLSLYVKAVFYSTNINNSWLKRCILKIVSFLIIIVSWTEVVINKCLPVVRLSACGLHMQDVCKNVHWLLSQFKNQKHFTLQTGNYFLSILIDTVIGVTVLYYLMEFSSREEVFEFVSTCTEHIVHNVTSLVEWLMGSPAGLKLNAPLNEIVGGFFLYNVKLWHSFLSLTRPVLELLFTIFLRLGLLGLSFQIAVLSDVLTIATFHAYSIYVYAARLYDVQLSGLCSLSRLFLGRKRNPEPGRIDSCPYTTEQLFIGTISFTVLLFLLPTILVYYVVFAMIRIGFVGLGGLMTRTRYLIQILPLYATWMWLFHPKRTAMTVLITPSYMKSSPNQVLLQARLVKATWTQTFLHCRPQTVSKPPQVQWGFIFKQFITGKLIYPF